MIGGLTLTISFTPFAVDFVEERLLRAYAFGCPPVAVKISSAVTGDAPLKRKMSSSASRGDIPYNCEILEAFGLQSSMVYGYVQPWVSLHACMLENPDSLFLTSPLLGSHCSLLYRV
jgi:hypothetical protein